MRGAGNCHPEGTFPTCSVHLVLSSRRDLPVVFGAQTAKRFFQNDIIDDEYKMHNYWIK
jgi:hypothetical protein